MYIDVLLVYIGVLLVYLTGTFPAFPGVRDTHTGAIFFVTGVWWITPLFTLLAAVAAVRSVWALW